MKPEPTLQALFEPQVLSFYAWWQLAVCTFAFLALMAIWWHIGRKNEDTGQVWLALSVLCWSLSGGVELYFSQKYLEQIQPLYELTALQLEGQATSDTSQLISTTYAEVKAYQEANAYKLDGWRSILSLLNSLFILLALPWFRYLPKPLEPIIKSNYWIFIVGLPFLFSLLPTISKMFSASSISLVSELDVYYSTLTLGFLGYVFWESFAKRRLIILAWLSLICILITFVAQLYKLSSSSLDLTLYSAIFKTSLTMIFFALALSWVKELSENVIPDSDRLFLSFHKDRVSADKINFSVTLGGIGKSAEKAIPLSPTSYKLLLLFAQRKLEGEEWLEIKPKADSRSEKTYDIQDHNEIKRLILALLDGLFGKGNWTKNLHESPLRKALFEMSEKRERKIRLKLSSSNLSLTKESSSS